MATIAEQWPGVRRYLGPEHADFPGEPQGVLHLMGEQSSTTVDGPAGQNWRIEVVDKCIYWLEWDSETRRALKLCLDKLSPSCVISWRIMGWGSGSQTLCGVSVLKRTEFAIQTILLLDLNASAFIP